MIMDETGKTAEIERFVAITGVDAERARFFLESSSWNLELAMSSFYEDAHEEEPIETSPSTSPQQGTSGTAANPAKTRSTKDKKPQSRFGTISGLHESDTDSEEEGQAYYAGGSEHGGGQQVLGPAKKKPEKLVEEMFEAAKEHGAEEVKADASTRKVKSSSFFGSGYRLGNTQVSGEVVPGASKPEQPREVAMVLKLWKNGFSVSDGPLREYNDPTNQEFLSAIKQGEVPRELIREARGGEVSLNMEDHRTEEYVAPKVTVKPFAGEGHRLGSAAPSVVSVTPAQKECGEAEAKSQLSINEGEPTTTIQIRLADSSRLIMRLNLHHTVGDIRKYIETARPELASANFALMTTFPNKELTDMSQSVDEAKLLNAVIVQRMK